MVVVVLVVESCAQLVINTAEVGRLINWEPIKWVPWSISLCSCRHYSHGKIWRNLNLTVLGEASQELLCAKRDLVEKGLGVLCIENR